MLVLGRFLPPTVADLERVRASGADAVGVVALPGDPIPVLRRVLWLRELLPGLSVHAFAEGDVLPGGAEVVRVLDAVAAAWVCARGASVVVVPDVLGAVAPEAVLRDPMRHWAALPRAVRPHFVRRVRIFGPESTGKSTLAAALAAHFGTVWVPEASRALYAAKGYHFTYEDVAAVAWAQLDAEEAAARSATRVLICDTDALTTLLYARHYFGAVPPLLARLAAERTYAATLLCHPDLPWVPDPCRDSPEARAHLFDVFRAELQARAVPYVDVTGSDAARTALGIRAVKAVLAGTPSAGAGLG